MRSGCTGMLWIVLAGSVLFADAQEALPTGLMPQAEPAATASTDATPADLPLRQRATFDLGSEEKHTFSIFAQFSAVYDDDIRGAAASGGGVLTQSSFFASVNKQWEYNSFRADYTPSFENYLQDSSLNFVSQDYDQEFIHKFTEHTELDWTGRVSRYSSRYFAVNSGTQFGDFNFTLPDLQSLSGFNDLTITNAGTQASIVHHSSESNTWTGGVFGGISRLTPDGTQQVLIPLAESFRTGGLNLAWAHQPTDKTSFGVSVTTAYTAQTGPSTHELEETIQGSVAHQVGKWTLSASAGPLLRQYPKNSPIVLGNSYVLSGTVQRKIGNSLVNAGYSRSLELGFENGSVISHNIYASVKHRFTERLFSVGALSYQRASYPGAKLSGAVLMAQLGYRVSRDLILTSSYGHGQQDAAGNLALLGYHRNQYSVGLMYDFTHLLPQGH